MDFELVGTITLLTSRSQLQKNEQVVHFCIPITLHIMRIKMFLVFSKQWTNIFYWKFHKNRHPIFPRYLVVFEIMKRSRNSCRFHRNSCKLSLELVKWSHFRSTLLSHITRSWNSLIISGRVTTTANSKIFGVTCAHDHLRKFEIS